ncbi:MAG: hypothetical protein KBF93_26360 [Leptospiraceae bacterium]|nr:hypothetical protein [Leptospiraceae bacterium]
MSLYFIIMATIGIACSFFVIFSSLSRIIARKVKDDMQSDIDEIKADLKHIETRLSSK